MKKVLVISLNGRAYSFEEDAFQALQTYLDEADKSLAGNPDREEILLDLEQAVGEKCNVFLDQRKNVVKATEISQVLQEMGPVAKEGDHDKAKVSDSANDAKSQTKDKQSTAHDSADVPKRLYLLHDGAIVAGLCTGIAAFLKVDVSIVRIVFVIFTLLSFGTGVLIYLSLIFIVPFAQTLEEHSAAQGLSFTAQELIEGAKRKLAFFSREHIQNRHWRRDFRKRWRSKKKQDWQTDAHSAYEPSSYQKRIFYGLLATLLTAIHAIFSTAWILVLLSVATTSLVFGHSFSTGVPLWAEILIVLLVGNILSAPLRASRHKIKQAAGRFGFDWLHSIDDLIWLGLVGGLFWYAYLHYPEVRTAVESLPEVWNRIVTSWDASVK